MSFPFLDIEGRKIYNKGMELKKNEVKKIMANTEAFRYYNQGLIKNRNGNICFIAGTLAFVIAIAGFNDTEAVYDGPNLTGNKISDSGKIMGVLGIGGGLAMFGIGTNMKIKGKKLIHQSVEKYNSGVNE